jgi:hypothetical protein
MHWLASVARELDRHDTGADMSRRIECCVHSTAGCDENPILDMYAFHYSYAAKGTGAAIRIENGALVLNALPLVSAVVYSAVAPTPTPTPTQTPTPTIAAGVVDVRCGLDERRAEIWSSVFAAASERIAKILPAGTASLLCDHIVRERVSRVASGLGLRTITADGEYHRDAARALGPTTPCERAAAALRAALGPDDARRMTCLEIGCGDGAGGWFGVAAECGASFLVDANHVVCARASERARAYPRIKGVFDRLVAKSNGEKTRFVNVDRAPSLSYVYGHQRAMPWDLHGSIQERCATDVPSLMDELGIRGATCLFTDTGGFDACVIQGSIRNAEKRPSIVVFGTNSAIPSKYASDNGQENDTIADMLQRAGYVRLLKTKGYDMFRIGDVVAPTPTKAIAPRARVFVIVDCPAGAPKFRGTHRLQEFGRCMRANCGLPFVQTVLSLSEFDMPPHILDGTLDKVKHTTTGQRLTFRRALDVAMHLFEREEGVLVICNADIRLDHPSFERCSAIDQKQCWALTRWNQHTDGTLQLQPRPDGSQDTWIFRLPIKHSFASQIPHSIEMGTPGCDNCIARFIQRAGMKISNPCNSIVTIHEHQGWQHVVYAANAVCNIVRHLRIPPSSI